MRIRRLLVLTLFTVAPALHSGGWAPIPPQVWAMKEDPAKGIKGAVILERRITFLGVQVEYELRLRILGESGRRAAELADFGEDSHSFEGRTVYPDGKEVPFSSRKDFTTRTVLSTSNTDLKRKVVIPPGVSSDCVVELRWKESADRAARSPLPRRLGYAGEWALGDAYPTLLSTVELPVPFSYAMTLSPGSTHTPEVKERNGFKSFTFRNLPAYEESPYSLQVARPLPRLSLFYQPEQLQSYARGTPQAFWDATAKMYVKEWFERGIWAGSTFRTFASELTGGVEGTPQAKARQILLRLDQRIQNRGHLTFEEAKTAEKKEEYPEDGDLNAAVKLGSASPFGMRILCYQLLKAAGVQVKIALVADRDVRLVRPSAMNLFQFSSVLLGVEELGQPTLWLDPGRRFAPPGMVHPDYQGNQMLLVEPATWTSTFVNLPPQGPDVNVRSYRYQVRMEEGEDQFSLDATFRGYPEYAERNRFLALEPKEQERLLREELEASLKQATFSRTQVLNAQTPGLPFGWHVEGRLEREEGRRREVHPFPVMRSPLSQPDLWPESRTDIIVIPFLRTHRAVSLIRIPKGYRVPQVEPIQERNGFGSVSWTLRTTEKPDEMEVTLEVVASRFLSAASAYQDFRTFMGWVSMAVNRSILLARES